MGFAINTVPPTTEPAHASCTYIEDLKQDILAPVEFLSGSDEIADDAAQTEQFDDVSRALPNPISNSKKRRRN